MIRRRFPLMAALSAGAAAALFLPGAAWAQLGKAEVAKHDKDGDGFVSRDEAPASWKANFDLADTDDDDAISAAEVDAAAKQIQAAIAAAAANMSGKGEVAKHDKDGDGFLSREEAPANWKPNFDVVDKDGDDLISVAEVDAVLKQMKKGAPPVAQPTGEGEVAKYDKDGDGFVSREEAPANWKPNFDAADTDDDQLISVAEVDTVLKTMREALVVATPPEGTQTHADLAYVEGGHERQKLDLHVPPTEDGQEKPKLIVWIHGGGWAAGGKENPPAMYLLKENFALASVNYRFSQHAVFPAQIEDCKTAIRWLRAHADEYGYDASEIGVWGASAGGHLVSLLGTAGDAKELDVNDLYPDQSSRVQAVCNYFGPTDFVNVEKHMTPVVTLDWKGADSLAGRLLGGPIADRPEQAKAASPLAYVTKDDAPFLTVHGDQDALVPIGQATALHEALDAAGVDNELIVVEGGGHGPFLDQVMRAKVFAFFQRTLRGEDSQDAPAGEKSEATN